MNIAIDLRSLSGGVISGVENYIVNLLEHLLPLDKNNAYTLFYNAWRGNIPHEFHYVNSKTKITRVPNKLLNLGLNLNLVNMRKLVGEVDCLFMPNLNQFAVEPGVKVAVTVHDMSPVITPELYDIKRRVWHRFLNYKKSFQRANIIFAVSEHTKLDLERLYDIPASKIKVVYPGVDHNLYNHNMDIAALRDVRHTYELPGDYLLFLNTVEPRKNLTNLLKAFELLPGRTSLVVAGRKGWKHGNIFRQMRRSKKSRYIKYIGYIEKERDKAAIISMARALVYPSLYEGFGFQPLEAMACGVPVLASRVTAIPEVVQDAGLLVDPFSVNDIAGALARILESRSLRETLIESGIKQAEKFRWNNTARQVLEGLNSIN